nr:hypothetical protein [Tanacetum cinerariifolium]
RPRPAKTVGTKPHSPPRRTINHRPSPTACNFPPKVTTVKVPKVNVVKGVKGNWGNPQHALKDKGVIDSGCLRHMIGNISAKTKKHDDKTTREAKGKSLVELSTRFRNLSEEFKDFSDNNIYEVNAASTSVLAVRQISTNSTNTFSADGPSNTDDSPTLRKSSYMDTS